MPEFGIPAVAKMASRQDYVSPYGAFPLVLADEPTALAWLKVMPDGPKMQTRYGVADAIAVDGTRAAPILTWDVKATLVLALAVAEAYREHGEHPISAALARLGKYQQITELLRQEFAKVFDDPPSGSSLPYATPTATFP